MAGLTGFARTLARTVWRRVDRNRCLTASGGRVKPTFDNPCIQPGRAPGRRHGACPMHHIARRAGSRQEQDRDHQAGHPFHPLVWQVAGRVVPPPEQAMLK